MNFKKITFFVVIFLLLAGGVAMAAKTMPNSKNHNVAAKNKIIIGIIVATNKSDITISTINHKTKSRTNLTVHSANAKITIMNLPTKITGKKINSNRPAKGSLTNLIIGKNISVIGENQPDGSINAARIVVYPTFGKK